MKRFCLVVVVFAFLPLFQNAVIGQEEIDLEKVEKAKDQIAGLYGDLRIVDGKIQFFEDIEVNEREYLSLKDRFGIWESNNQSYVLEEEEISKKYESYRNLQYELEKKMDSLKADKEKQDKIQKVASKFVEYQSQMQSLERQGNKCQENKRIDSLNMIKNKASDCFSQSSAFYMGNQEMVDENDSIKLLWNDINDINSRIKDMNIVPIKWGDLVFKIVIVCAALFFGINLIAQKIKMKKMTQITVDNHRKKKEENMPSI